MNREDAFYRKSGNYRIWVDESGVGRIRILKRINFTTLVSLFEELHAEIKNRIAGNPGKVHIVFYISKSLYCPVNFQESDKVGITLSSHYQL